MRPGATMWEDCAPSRSSGRAALIVLEVFTGLTALGGGVLLMARPDGSLLAISSAALSALKYNSPFPDFVIPGLALTAVGGGMLGSAALLVRHRPAGLDLAIVSGAALVVFEVVEYAGIGFMPLQAFEGVVGLLVLASAAALRRRGAYTGRRIPA